MEDFRLQIENKSMLQLEEFSKHNFKDELVAKIIEDCPGEDIEALRNICHYASNAANNAVKDRIRDINRSKHDVEANMEHRRGHNSVSAETFRNIVTPTLARIVTPLLSRLC